MVKNEPQLDCFSETEAASMLGISVERLHRLLDEHIFNDGSIRPPDLTLRSADLVLLKFWDRGPDDMKVIRMPKRG
ncbi:MAG TPA: hypothetical protein VFP40_10405 [Terriglobales bacterium]|nr:hypothetical protein [Terriglobales bacterium]